MHDENELLWNTMSSFAPISVSGKELLSSKLKEVPFKKKDRLIDAQEIFTGYVFIKKGLARLYGYKEGEEKTLFFFREGMFAGSIQSYLSEKPSQLVLEAMEDIDGLLITKEELDEVFEKSDALAKALMRYTQIRLNGLLHFFSSFVLDSPEERYEKFIRTEPELLNRVPQHVIASFLGITPVSLSRIRKRISNKR